MSDVNSAWTLEVDLSKGRMRRKRNFSTSTGVKALPLEKKLRDLFMGLAGLAQMVGDEFTHDVVENKAEELAYGWARVAQENESVRIALNWMVETNAWTDAVIPTVMVGGSIAWRYNLLPDKIGEPIAKFSGAVPMTPEEEAVIAEQMAQAQAQMEAEQREAEQPAPSTASETEPEAAINADEAITPDSDSGPSVVPLGDADFKPDN